MPVFAAVTAGVVAAWLFALGALGVDGWVAWRVWKAPSERFRHGGWSKLGWIIAIFWVGWHLGPIALPVGAVLAWSRLWSPSAPTGAIPMAEGEFPPEGWS